VFFVFPSSFKSSYVLSSLGMVCITELILVVSSCPFISSNLTSFSDVLSNFLQCYLLSVCCCPQSSIKITFFAHLSCLWSSFHYHTTKLLLKGRYAVLILSHLSHGLIISLLFIVLLRQRPFLQQILNFQINYNQKPVSQIFCQFLTKPFVCFHNSIPLL
jgi:hypothetical protein